jgi:hypothetical protein
VNNGYTQLAGAGTEILQVSNRPLNGLDKLLLLDGQMCEELFELFNVIGVDILLPLGLIQW